MRYDDDNFNGDEAFEEMAAAEWFRDNVDIRDEDVEEMDRDFSDDEPEMDRFEDDRENFELDQLAHDAYLEAQAELMNESYDVDEDF